MEGHVQRQYKQKCVNRVVEIKGNEQNMKNAGAHQSDISSKEVKACFSTKHIWLHDNLI